MSRIGKLPIDLPAGVTATAQGDALTIKGPQGELSYTLPAILSVEVNDKQVTLTRPDDTKESKSFHGLARSLVYNMVEGVTKGFTRELEIEGVGFRAAIQGQKLVLTVGYSSPVEYQIPDGVKVEEDGGTKLKVSGASKQKVGEVAARIRAFAPAEPYKGKGLRYKGERVRRKVGKTVA